MRVYIYMSMYIYAFGGRGSEREREKQRERESPSSSLKTARNGYIEEEMTGRDGAEQLYMLGGF